jgi:hypothetical protein
MWLLKDGRCFTRPDAFLRVLVGEGECIGTQEAVLDENVTRVVEKWVLDDVEFFTSYDKVKEKSERMGPDGLTVVDEERLTDRRVLMSVDLFEKSYVPKERWVEIG